MTKKLLLLPIAILAMLMCPTKAWAQKNTVTGKVTEMRSGETLVGATAVLLNPKDSAQVSGAVTGETGVFTISPKNGGKYILRISFIGYENRIPQLDNLITVPVDRFTSSFFQFCF